MFSLDFVVSAALVLAAVSSALAVLGVAASEAGQDALGARAERGALLEADRLMKTCYPAGIASCEGSFVFTHVADVRAVLSGDSGAGGKTGVCVKRVVLQSGNPEVFRSCPRA